MKKLFTLASVFLFTALIGRATTHIVDQTNLTFNPNALEVEVGDIIEWHWSAGSHTTTSILVPASADPWDAPLNSGEPTFQYTVEVAGTYAYKCTPHFNNQMVGGFIASAVDAILEMETETELTVTTMAQNNAISINASTTVAGNATIEVLDISGRFVATIFNDQLGIGEKKITFDTSILNRGIYFVHFSLNGKEMTKKFIAG